jgi:hypothetical protein
MMPRYCCFSNTKLDWSSFEALVEFVIRIFSSFAPIMVTGSALRMGGLVKMCVKVR